MAKRLVSVDEKYNFPKPLEDRLSQADREASAAAIAASKTYADAEVAKDRARLFQAEATDVKQAADIRETLRAALAYADAKATDIQNELDTSHVALDTDGTPYYRPGSTTVKVRQDADGTPFYEAS